ncbi:MAG: hypothetical protein V1781_05420 [Bacteroidota bacterium]
MKKRLIIFIVILLAIIVAFIFLYQNGIFFKKIIGNNGISEGVIEYDITYPKLDPKNMMVSGMPDKAYLRFKNDNILNDMSGMMGLICITYISNYTDKSVTQALNLIGKKYASNISPDELKQSNESYIAEITDGKNTQTIAGFKCKESIAKLKNGENVHVYSTDDIMIKNSNWSNPYYKINGVLMDFQIERYGITMHLVCKQVLQQKIDDSIFKISSDSSYKKIPFAKLEGILKELNPSY